MRTILSKIRSHYRKISTDNKRLHIVTRLKNIIVKLIISLSILTLLCFLIVSSSPIIDKNQDLAPADVQKAKDFVKQLHSKFTSPDEFIQVTLPKSDLDAIMVVASYTIPQSRFEARLSPFGVNILASKYLSISNIDLFFNFNCLFVPGFDHFEIENCSLGSITFPGWLVKWVIETGTKLVFDKEVQKTLSKFVESGQIENDSIVFTTTKDANFKNSIKSSVSNIAPIMQSINNSNDVNSERVLVYINKLQTIDQSSSSLAFYVGSIFSFAQEQSTAYNPVSENTAALWALAIVYGNNNFAKLIGLPDLTFSHINRNLTIKNRGDLRLHFLYSIVLEQVGKTAVGLSIGEIKELLDSNKGGSGFSFTDLAADKAGLMLSKFSTKDEYSAIKAQKILANIKDEAIFFPYIHDLLDGFTSKEFKDNFNKIGSPAYKVQEQRIDDRISRLPLYRDNKTKTSSSNTNSAALFPDKNTQWLTVDTHIHSDFSDGNKTISQIARQAYSFGCDAIAITDHGYYNFEKVASKEYFNVITSEDNNYPYMTIIPGLEWNIPPFMGREHATVLLPEYTNTQNDLSTFKERFDSSGEKQHIIDASEALSWLDKKSTFNNIKPIVFYNHPSRKDQHQGENKQDLEEWTADNNIVIGMSGAPGHQRRRDESNGSYTTKIKTIHGWDPSIATVGAEWDQLLQQGYNLWAARAPSDFHTTKHDFWPCQFSTTHLRAKSLKQNDILQALRNGNFWAQQGKFVNSLDFKVHSGITSSTIGQTLPTTANQKIKVKLTIKLNNQDWQDFDTTLDEVELIVITNNSIKTIFYEPLRHTTEDNKTYTFIYEYPLKAEDVVFRWRGKSIQPEQHHYMFYTNPIRVKGNM